jgi:hypothetical protein
VIDESGQPWYATARRWAQTNLTEIDPSRYDHAFWREQWRRTKVDGVIVNAGGIVAYYPSRFPLQHRAETLGKRDLYGEIVTAAREDGLAVLARMDSNRADPQFYFEHPDWFTVDQHGEPYRAGELYVACINSPYYHEYLPEVLREIIDRSSPDGLSDNSWSGLERDKVCYCKWCSDGFRQASGLALPRSVDWSDDAYRRWVEWSYTRRLAVWDLNNSVTKAAGGENCLWLGMNGGELISQSQRLRDHRAILERTPILMLDSQYRHPSGGFQANGDSGKLIHEIIGWDAVVPESTAMYDASLPTFRLASKPTAEARMWAVEGFAAGIQPWWHHISAEHEDRRQYETAEPLFSWHAEHENSLFDRTPIASVGVVWSQRSLDFYGREQAATRSELPYRGTVDALIRHRIPYLPVHVDDVSEKGSRFRTLVLPNVGSLTEEQSEALHAYAASGGNLVISGETGRYDEWGEARDDSLLADLTGVNLTGSHHGGMDALPANWEHFDGHTYLRIEDHGRTISSGFEQTSILPFGGRLDVVALSAEAKVALSWIPQFPIYPPEKSWMRHTTSGLPTVVLNESDVSRVVYFAADIDRLFGRYHHPDHGRLLANAVRWASHDDIPLTVEGAGQLDCHLFTQGARKILHLVNLSQGGAWYGELEEIIGAGPFRITVRTESPSASARLLVAGTSAPSTIEGDLLTIEVPRVFDHEVVVIEPQGAAS